MKLIQSALFLLLLSSCASTPPTNDKITVLETFAPFVTNKTDYVNLLQSLGLSGVKAGVTRENLLIQLKKTDFRIKLYEGDIYEVIPLNAVPQSSKVVPQSIFIALENSLVKKVILKYQGDITYVSTD